MTKDQFLKELKKNDACGESTAWVKSLPEDADPWHLCKRGDWMVRFAFEYGVDRRLVVWAVCECVKSLYAKMPDTLNAAFLWCGGMMDIDDVKKHARRWDEQVSSSISNLKFHITDVALGDGFSVSTARAFRRAATDTAILFAVSSVYNDTAVDAALAVASFGDYKRLEKFADIVRKIIPDI